MSEGRAEPGRRVLDEALRLLDVLQATRPASGARDRGPDGAGLDGEHGGEHGGPECRYCPLCRGLAYLREVDPGALGRVTDAVSDLASAVRDLVGGVPGAAGHGRAGDADAERTDERPVDVQRIDVQQIDVQRIDLGSEGPGL